MTVATFTATATTVGLCNESPLPAMSSSPESPAKRRLSGQGSLPLKKRIRFTPAHHGFSLDESYYSSSSSESGESVSQNGFVAEQQGEAGEEASRSSAGAASTSGATGAEKLAALALIAASTTTTMAANASSLKAPSVPLLKEHRVNLTLTAGSSARPLPMLSPRASITAASNASNASFMNASSGSPTASPVTSQKQTLRGHPAPLANPLPGGCHFKTSRNNSFCRRHSYNGSKYCKLHYHHYKIALEEHQQQLSPLVSSSSSVASAGSEGNTAHKAPSVQGHDGKSSCSLPSSPVAAVTAIVPSSGESPHAAVAATVIIPVPHQDRRYSSASPQGEKRCLATTTRGRPCAYVSVNGTKYCYLHADYDTNPPPRRGGSCQQTHLQHRHKLQPVANLKTATTGGKSLVDVSLSSSKDLSASQLSVPLAVEDMSSPSYSSLTLLSMISTDRWFKKLVIVAAGPLIHRTGRVEKWGNGWVTVRIPGMGVHNRRSFELYLHPKQEEVVPEEQNPSGDALEKMQIQAQLPNQGVKQINSQEANIGPALTRCVSQDTVAASSSTRLFNSILASAILQEHQPTKQAQGHSVKTETEFVAGEGDNKSLSSAGVVTEVESPNMITDHDSLSPSSTPPPETSSPAYSPSTTGTSDGSRGSMHTPMQEASSLLLLLQGGAKQERVAIITPSVPKNVADRTCTGGDEIASLPFMGDVGVDANAVSLGKVNPSATIADRENISSGDESLSVIQV